MALLKKRSKQKAVDDDSDESNPEDADSLVFPTAMEEYEFEGRIGRGAFAFSGSPGHHVHGHFCDMI